MSAEFLDTNILAYAYDRTSGDKHVRANKLVERLVSAHDGAISIQVLQELFVTLTRKGHRMETGEARSVILELAALRVIAPAATDVLRGIDLADRHDISFWDAMIITTARLAGAEIVWSEDLNHGQDYGGVVVRNPFIDEASSGHRN